MSYFFEPGLAWAFLVWEVARARDDGLTVCRPGGKGPFFAPSLLLLSLPVNLTRATFLLRPQFREMPRTKIADAEIGYFLKTIQRNFSLVFSIRNVKGKEVRPDAGRCPFGQGRPENFFNTRDERRVPEASSPISEVSTTPSFSILVLRGV